MELGVEVEQELRDIYYDPKTGYVGAEKLYQRVKGLGVSRKKVKKWLTTQDTYTRHKPIVRRHKFRVTFVNYLGEELQMDLVDVSAYSRHNKGYYWILTGIEVLSRYAFGIEVYRKDTANMKQAVRELLDNFKDRFGRDPKLVQFDDGKEFYNVGVKKLLGDRDVEYFSTNSDKKAAVVERFNRSLKAIMWKYFYANGTHRWIDVLDQFVENYNDSANRGIMMKPKDVNKSNEGEVWTTLFGHQFADNPLPKFSVGDSVRISKYKSVFTKGYEVNFTEELFKVVRVIRGDPSVYEIEDTSGERIIGKFYEQELSLVNKGANDTYRVEKILKRTTVRGKKMVLVKWLGYDSKHNSWIPESYIQNVS